MRLVDIHGSTWRAGPTRRHKTLISLIKAKIVAAPNDTVSMLIASRATGMKPTGFKFGTITP
jgi:hypothetical protein